MRKILNSFSFLCVIVLMIASFSSVSLAHTIYGTTGLINIPSASVAPSGSISFGYDWFKGRSNVSVNLGAFPGVEAGLASQFTNNGNHFSGNVKVNLLEEGDHPAVSVGLRAASERLDFYLVSSMQIGAPGVRAHLGFGSGRYNSGFAGISAVLNPVSVSSGSSQVAVPVTTMIIEYDGNGLNTGVKMRFDQKLEGRVVISDFKSLGLGINYNHRF